MVINDDNIPESAENFTVALSTPVREVNEPQLVDVDTLRSVEVTINDNDTPTSGKCMKL